MGVGPAMIDGDGGAGPLVLLDVTLPWDNDRSAGSIGFIPDTWHPATGAPDLIYRACHPSVERNSIYGYKWNRQGQDGLFTMMSSFYFISPYPDYVDGYVEFFDVAYSDPTYIYGEYSWQTPDVVGTQTLGGTMVAQGVIDSSWPDLIHFDAWVGAPACPVVYANLVVTWQPLTLAEVVIPDPPEAP